MLALASIPLLITQATVGCHATVRAPCVVTTVWLRYATPGKRVGSAGFSS
jgi:hypothetical protein